MEMNKYQEALNTLEKHAHESPKIEWVLIHEVNAIQELVDKETPMKPIFDRMDLLCGRCESVGIKDYNELVNEVYCSRCGQRIDWGKEDE